MVTVVVTPFVILAVMALVTVVECFDVTTDTSYESFDFVQVLVFDVFDLVESFYQNLEVLNDPFYYF